MSSESVGQLTAITGCSEAAAKELLSRYDGNLERALNSFYEAQDQSVTFHQPWNEPPAYDAQAGGNSKDNTLPIDLTGDGIDDEDIRKAMEASLQDSQPGQHYAPQPAASSQAMIGPMPESQQTLSEDEQLRQALEASVQSHNGGAFGTEASGSRTPLLPPHLELGEQSQRKDGAPVALVSPFATIDVIAAVLQAMFASTPARHAFLNFFPHDERVTDLANYWKGVSPRPDTKTPLFDEVDDRQKAQVDLCRRIQTLFAFMNQSERAVCVVTDVSSLTSNGVHMMGANKVPPSTIATTYYEFVLSSFEEAVKAATAVLPPPSQTDETPPPPPTLDEIQQRVKEAQTKISILHSYGAKAYASPPSPVDGQDADDVPPPDGIPVARAHIRVEHDSVNHDISSCLRAALAADGEGALITEPAAVLSMAIDHRAGEEPLPPFAVEETLFLDPFLWDRRKGLRLESELYAPEIQSTLATIQKLEARKQKLDGSGDKEPAALLKGAIDYFERLTDDGNDAMRRQGQGEAATRLRQVLAKVEQERRDTDALIARLRALVNAKRLELSRHAQEEAAKPEWRKVAYELCAVLVHESHRIVAYVRQRDGKWWRTCDGVATEVTAAEATSDKMRDANSAGVFWVSYQRRQYGQLPDEPCPEAIQSAVEEDNLTLQSELLSLARSGAATPVASSADAVTPADPATTTPASDAAPVSENGASEAIGQQEA
ncbi:uncharacterized protein PSFLO_02368 [Pseudozyma flocculosa]|uniref:UBA domain-containing protein n=1 Tax=Pseudozyma flocculosa TaxID=84751 RepID=A0A5C3EZQ4_9BASI|nr:uncharacterized protein PSFLO_02368 [Pseudozyma flocculosa]